MAKGTITVEGKDYNYADYLAKVFEYVQVKGFNKEAFQHTAALFWDLDKRTQALEEENQALRERLSALENKSLDTGLEIPSTKSIKADKKAADKPAE